MESTALHNGLPDWRVYAKQAEDFERQRRWEDAIPIRIAARDSALQVLGEEDEQVLSLTKELAQLYVQLGHFMEALPLLHAFLKQRERKGHAESKNVWAVLQQLGQIYIKLQRPTVAVEYLLRAYHMAGKLFEKHDVNVGIISVTLGRSVLSLCRAKKCRNEDLTVAMEAAQAAIDICTRHPDDKFTKSLPKIYMLQADLAKHANDRVREGEALVAAVRLLKASALDASLLEQRLRRLQQGGDTGRRAAMRDDVSASIDYSMSEEEADDDRLTTAMDFDDVVLSLNVQTELIGRAYSDTSVEPVARSKSVSCPITPRGRTPSQLQSSPLAVTVTHSPDVNTETTSLPVSPLVTRFNTSLPSRSRSSSVTDFPNNPFAAHLGTFSTPERPVGPGSNCASPISMRGILGVRHRHSDPTLRLRADAYQRTRSLDAGGACSPVHQDEPDHPDSPRRSTERRGSLTTMPPLCETDPTSSLLMLQQQHLEQRVFQLEARPGSLDACSEGDLLALITVHQQALQSTQVALERLRARANSKLGTNDAPKCKHCDERPVETCLKPCNHACLCRTCCATAFTCPLCTKPIETRLSVSFSL